MANLQRTASQFFINFLFIFILTMTMYSFFRTIGAFSASLDVGMYNPRSPEVTVYVDDVSMLTNIQSHSSHGRRYSSPSRIYRLSHSTVSFPFSMHRWKVITDLTIKMEDASLVEMANLDQPGSICF